MKQGPYQSQWIPRDTVARVKRLDLLAYLERYDPHELVRVSRDVYATAHPRQPEDQQWEVVLVVPGDRRPQCVGLSD